MKPRLLRLQFELLRTHLLDDVFPPDRVLASKLETAESVVSKSIEELRRLEVIDGHRSGRRLADWVVADQQFGNFLLLFNDACECSVDGAYAYKIRQDRLIALGLRDRRLRLSLDRAEGEREVRALLRRASKGGYVVRTSGRRRDRVLARSSRLRQQLEYVRAACDHFESVIATTSRIPRTFPIDFEALA